MKFHIDLVGKRQEEGYVKHGAVAWSPGGVVIRTDLTEVGRQLMFQKQESRYTMSSELPAYAAQTVAQFSCFEVVLGRYDTYW